MKKITRDSWLIVVFCMLAAVRVFIYSAAFPFFNNVDEHLHFDLVIKYSQGHIPHSLEAISPKSAEYIVRYGSLEYLYTSADFPEKRFPQPMWKQPEEKVQHDFDKSVADWISTNNHESSQPPLYYMIAGIWTKLGALVGFKGGWFLYWIRFLNVFLAGGLVWTAYLAALSVFPENRFITLGVPLLAAFLPQDAYYSIQSDVLSPFFFGLALINMAKFSHTDVPSPWHGILTGLVVAATALVKITNLPLLVVSVIYVLLNMRRLNKLAPAALPVGLFALCALIPVFIWFVSNFLNYGDLTATASKIQMLGWTHKTLFGWHNHPIFTPQGAWIFWSELMDSFWRGEFVWFGTRILMPAADVFYWLSSLVLVVLAMISVRQTANALQWRMIWFSFWSFAVLVIFMGLLSTSFDFGKCYYPSQEHPYFTSGRLVSATLIPFLLLYVKGLDCAFSWIKSERLRFGILVVIVLFVTVSEIIINRAAFFSHYNLFHM